MDISSQPNSPTSRPVAAGPRTADPDTAPTPRPDPTAPQDSVELSPRALAAVPGSPSYSVEELREMIGGDRAGDFNGLAGLSIEEMIARVPPGAEIELIDNPRFQGGGYNFTWYEGDTRMGLSMHGPDTEAPAGSRGADGWTARVRSGRRRWNPTGGENGEGAFEPQPGPNSDRRDDFMRDTHIPLEGHPDAPPRAPRLPDAPDRVRPTSGGPGLGRIAGRAGGFLATLGLAGWAGIEAAEAGEDVAAAVGESLAENVPGGHSAIAASEGNWAEAAMGGIEEFPILGTAVTEILRPLLRGQGVDVEPGLMESGIEAGRADAAARREYHDDVLEWVHEIGAVPDREVAEVVFERVSPGEEDPAVHFLIGPDGRIQSVHDSEEVLPVEGIDFLDETTLRIGLALPEPGEPGWEQVGEEQAVAAAELALGLGLEYGFPALTYDFGLGDKVTTALADYRTAIDL